MPDIKTALSQALQEWEPNTRSKHKGKANANRNKSSERIRRI